MSKVPLRTMIGSGAAALIALTGGCTDTAAPIAYVGAPAGYRAETRPADEAGLSFPQRIVLEHPEYPWLANRLSPDELQGVRAVQASRLAPRGYPVLPPAPAAPSPPSFSVIPQAQAVEVRASPPPAPAPAAPELPQPIDQSCSNSGWWRINRLWCTD
jgi:hypothetical protein